MNLFEKRPLDRPIAYTGSDDKTAPHDESLRDAESLAQFFHDMYERLAPQYGYETRDDTKEFDATSPNGKLMIAVSGEVVKLITAHELQARIDELNQLGDYMLSSVKVKGRHERSYDDRIAHLKQRLEEL